MSATTLETFDPLRRRSLRRIWTVAAVTAATYSILPLVWTLSSSLKPGRQIFEGLSPLTWQAIVPTSLTLDHYVGLMDGTFPRALANSVTAVVLAVTIGITVSALAAYGLAMFRYKGQAFLFGIVVVSFLIPFDSVALPLSDLFRSLRLDNTLVGLMLPGIGNGFAVFLLRQFFLGIPRELIEAARVDGLSDIKILFQIVMPLSKPALLSAAQLIFIFQWQSFLWPLLIATNPKTTVAPVALASFAGQFDVDFGQMFAGSVLTIVVPMTVLLLSQRYFVNSIAASGTKA